ncbi:hypothetical protein [Kitasatospora sp. NPDC092286]|uniref:hypothetical protein n=1 Tax=Kitasatospora sp. NPDC092286 TaxID=3364087 RepID=UPI003803A7EF
MTTRTPTTPGFLRALGEHRLITPLRSDGGHRRCSRYQLRIAIGSWSPAMPIAASASRCRTRPCC